MIKIITTYIQQRFQIQMYLPLAVLLVLFGIKHYNLTINEWMQELPMLPMALAFLLFFRLIDDLINRKEDQNKPNRNYTENKSWTPLCLFASIILLLGISLAFQVYQDNFMIYLLVIGLSIIPYAFRFLIPQLNFVYPLFKYGLLVLFMNSVHNELDQFDYIFSGIVVLGFLLYEVLEDALLLVYQKHVKWMYWLLAISFAFLDPNAIILIGIASLSLYLFWLIRKPKYMHYYILLLILSLKIIVYVV
jgi:hypothetical protein